jgi:hypothetical protein
MAERTTAGTPRSRHAARLRAHRRRAQARARRLVLGALVVALLVLTLVITAFAGEDSSATRPTSSPIVSPATTDRP